MALLFRFEIFAIVLSQKKITHGFHQTSDSVRAGHKLLVIQFRCKSLTGGAAMFYFSGCIIMYDIEEMYRIVTFDLLFNNWLSHA